jgi:hypothetical protein
VTYELLTVALIALIILILWLSNLAGRVDRLNHRIELAAASLDSQLVRRSSAAESLATSGLLDPATSMVLAVAAMGARATDPRDTNAREAAESELSNDLRLALGDPETMAELRENQVGAELLADLGTACRRVELARRFHNEAVVACRQLRRKPMVRVFRLAGSAPYPRTVEMDDEVPQALLV